MREVVYNALGSGIFQLPNKPIVVKPEKSSSSEHPTSAEKSSSSNHSSDYYEYISSWEKISGKGLKLLTLKQMLQKLPIALTQVKGGNTSENVLNEIHRIIYSLYWAKKITKKVNNSIVNSIKL